MVSACSTTKRKQQSPEESSGARDRRDWNTPTISTRAGMNACICIWRAAQFEGHVCTCMVPSSSKQARQQGLQFFFCELAVVSPSPMGRSLDTQIKARCRIYLHHSIIGRKHIIQQCSIILYAGGGALLYYNNYNIQIARVLNYLDRNTCHQINIHSSIINRCSSILQSDQYIVSTTAYT